jgi:hypothetical protein
MNEPAIFFEDVNERQGGFLRRTFVLGGGGSRRSFHWLAEDRSL